MVRALRKHKHVVNFRSLKWNRAYAHNSTSISQSIENQFKLKFPSRVSPESTFVFNFLTGIT